MKRQQIAFYLSKFTKIFNQFMIVILVGLIAFLGIQLHQNNKLLLSIAQSNKEKLDQALPVAFPLKFDTPQTVLREPPVFHLDEPIDVEARFLNETNLPITLSADVHWVLVTQTQDMASIEPIEVGLFLTLQPGCTKIPFSNKRPAAVDTVTRKLFAEGHERVVWKLNGFNQIISPSVGGRQAFEVDQFSYIPDDKPIPATQINQVEDNCDTLSS